MKNKMFPDDFIWGAGTSSHQIEGGTNNDWTEWEKLPGKIKTGEVSGKAANSWELYEKDFDLLEQMNLNAYRFSVEWSRLEPEPGKFDLDALNRYKLMLESLKNRGITPVVTIHHFTNPLWLNDWSSKKVIAPYLRFVEFLVSNLGEYVSYWITINEPNVFAYMGYQIGAWPPGEKNLLKEKRVLKVMHSAHKQAYKLINDIYQKENRPKPKISMAFNLQHYIALDDKFSTKKTTKLANYFNNDYNIVRTLDCLDFIGVNHYFTHWVKGFSVNNDPADIPRNDLSWPMYPEGLYLTLMDVKKYNLPILITENGIPDGQDKTRSWFITAYLKQVHRAINEGAPVIGYMHWSLIDNWEWWDGFSGRFGLAETNFITFERKLRDSGALYGEIAKNNALPDSIQEQA